MALFHSEHRSYKGRRQVRLLGRHRQRRSHPAKPHQRRETGAECGDCALGTGLLDLLAQVPGQLLQSQRPVQHRQALLVQ